MVANITLPSNTGISVRQWQGNFTVLSGEGEGKGGREIFLME